MWLRGFTVYLGTPPKCTEHEMRELPNGDWSYPSGAYEAHFTCLKCKVVAFKAMASARWNAIFGDGSESFARAPWNRP